MATEILINDGGAPARILPFTAGEALVAGEPVMVEAATGDIIDTTAQFGMAGIALNAAADQEMVNVITGSGIVVRALVGNGAAIGDYLKVGNGLLVHIPNATTAEALTHVGFCLEANSSGGDALTKVLII